MNPEDQTQLTQLWMESQSSLLAYILSSVGNFADSEDILQQVAHDVSAGFSRYDPQRPFLPWAMLISKRRIVDYYRKEKRSPRFLEEIDLDLLARTHADYARSRKRTGEFADLLEECIDRLPERSRKLIELRYRDDLKPAEIAKAIGRSAGGIRVALCKLRSALGECIRTAAERGEP